MIGNGRTRIYTGREALEAAEALRREVENRDRWPYPHVYPPPNSTPVNKITSPAVNVPAAGPANQVTVLEYTVPSGKRFIMQGIIQQEIGATFLPGDGTWLVDQNTPLVLTSVQSSPVPYLSDLIVPLGSFSFEPFPFKRAYEFEPLTVLRSKFTNVNLGEDSGKLVSGFFGYLIPAIGAPAR